MFIMVLLGRVIMYVCCIVYLKIHTYTELISTQHILDTNNGAGMCAAHIMHTYPCTH